MPLIAIFGQLHVAMLAIEKKLNKNQAALLRCRTEPVSKQPHETKYQQRRHRSVVSRQRQSDCANTYMPANNHPPVQEMCEAQTAMCGKGALTTPALDTESDAAWLSPRSSLLREYFYPDEQNVGGQPTCPVGYPRPIAEQEKDEADTPPELHDGYQTSESGDFSLAEELVAQYLRTKYPIDFETTLEPCKSPTENASQIKHLSRFSWGSSIDSEAERESNIAHKVPWTSPRPESVAMQKQSWPPLPPRNPLRLLKKVNGGAAKGISNVTRGSRNLKNLRLSLTKTKAEEMWKTNKNRISRRMQASARPVAASSMQSSQLLESKYSSTNHIVSAMSETSSQWKPKSLQRDMELDTVANPPRRYQTSEHYTANTNGTAETSDYSHCNTIRDSSESIHIGTGKRNKRLDKWGASRSMPPLGSIRRSCTTGVTPNNTRLKAPLLPFDINKRLPPLPAVAPSAAVTF